MIASFSRCRFVRVLLVAVVFWLRMTDTIVVFSVWAADTLKLRSSQSRALAAGWLVSRTGARLTTPPCPGAFLPGGAWGADEFVDGPFHGQKPLVRLLRPHYPRQRSGQGVHGNSPGGERSRCTCAHETPPLGGTVRVSRPRPVSWQPLSRPKLTVLRARQPPPCTPWLSCRFTKLGAQTGARR